MHRIESNLFQIANNVKSISKMVQNLGTSQDTHDMRDRLHAAQDATRKLARDTGHLLKQTDSMTKSDGPEARNRRMQHQKLSGLWPGAAAALGQRRAALASRLTPDASFGRTRAAQALKKFEEVQRWRRRRAYELAQARRERRRLGRTRRGTVCRGRGLALAEAHAPVAQAGQRCACRARSMMRRADARVPVATGARD